MNRRDYNMMMDEAEMLIIQMMEDFDRQFFARELRSAQAQLDAVNAFREITAEPEPIPEIPPPIVEEE